LFLDAFIANKVDFLSFLIIFVPKMIIFSKIKNPGGPPKELRGPLDSRGPRLRNTDFDFQASPHLNRPNVNTTEFSACPQLQGGGPSPRYICDLFSTSISD